MWNNDRSAVMTCDQNPSSDGSLDRTPSLDGGVEGEDGGLDGALRDQGELKMSRERRRETAEI